MPSAGVRRDAMTNGTKLRMAKRLLRALCVKNGHQWTGDDTCEVCGVSRG